MRRALALAALALCGCPKKPEEPKGELLSLVKEKLTARDGKVQSYHLAGATRQQGQDARFEFFYRHPNRMKGSLTQPVRRSFSWDGQKLFEVVEDDKRFITYEMKLPPHKSLLFLTQTFAPFAPEGYRAPLLLSEGVTATRTSHPRAAEAIEVRQQTKDESGNTLSVTYVLRWPSMDFLKKTSELGGTVSEIRVDAEHCEEPLKLCFPKQLSQWEGGHPVATTALSTVEINPPLPADSFTLTAPEGFEVKSQELIER